MPLQKRDDSQASHIRLRGRGKWNNIHSLLDQDTDEGIYNNPAKTCSISSLKVYADFPRTDYPINLVASRCKRQPVIHMIHSKRLFGQKTYQR